MARLVLAATLSSNYGIYGPAFEHMVHAPREPGSEEYLNSEKYQLCHWDHGRADSLADFIARVNAIRQAHTALQRNDNLRFLDIDNESLLAYMKHSEDSDDLIVVVVNLDPHHPQSGWVTLETDTLRVDDAAPYQMHELLTDARYLWHGRRNYVSIDPHRAPAHVFRLRRRVRREQDFDYFL
jgi:starch synthase (maltosyl-transferring)